jgi:hypothetical protein
LYLEQSVGLKTFITKTADMSAQLQTARQCRLRHVLTRWNIKLCLRNTLLEESYTAYGV